MNPVVNIEVKNEGGTWDCHCSSDSWYAKGCKFINFHLNGNNLHYDVIFPDGHVDKDRHHKIDCISFEHYSKINLTLKFEDGTELVFNVKDKNEVTDLVEILEQYNSNGYELVVDHSYELDEGFDDI